MKNWKSHPKKLLRIGPDPFFPKSSPGNSQQPKIDFPCYEILGPDICSLICESNLGTLSENILWISKLDYQQSRQKLSTYLINYISFFKFLHRMPTTKLKYLGSFLRESLYFIWNEGSLWQLSAQLMSWVETQGFQ